MPGTTPISTLDREKRIKDLAHRVALSQAFATYFGRSAAPELWEPLVRTWDDERMDTITLILDEEDSMRKHVAMEVLRKKQVGKTKLLEKIEEMRIKAHESKK